MKNLGVKHLVKRIVFGALQKTKRGQEYVDVLVRRVNICHVGMGGCGPSEFDRDIMKRDGLKPFGRLGQWFWKEEIEALQEIHKDCFKNACIEVLGEDPDDWGLTEREYCEKYGVRK